jgi:hypothetical protein
VVAAIGEDVVAIAREEVYLSPEVVVIFGERWRSERGGGGRRWRKGRGEGGKVQENEGKKGDKGKRRSEKEEKGYKRREFFNFFFRFGIFLHQNLKRLKLYFLFRFFGF